MGALDGGPEQVLEYLGRYTHRVAISNERIVGIVGDSVAFRVRADPSCGSKRTICLPGSEFIGRFLQHVLPAGFKRIRHYGLLSAARKKDGLAAARAALAVPPPDAAVVESVSAFLRRVARIAHEHCPNCTVGTFQVVATLLPERSPMAPRAPPWTSLRAHGVGGSRTVMAAGGRRVRVTATRRPAPRGEPAGRCGVALRRPFRTRHAAAGRRTFMPND